MHNLRLNDIELSALKQQPTPAAGQAEDAEIQAEWRKKTIMAKSIIILTLVPQPTTALANIIEDEEKYPKDLWDELS